MENKWQNINLYFQDESRFGLKTDIEPCLTSKGIKPIVSYQHKFANTCLYGTYSPSNGDSFVWEVEGVSNVIFEKHLKDFSSHKRDEFKIVIIDNAGFHATKNIKIPENIFLLRIPPYSPELNLCEQIWEYIKPKYKNKIFKTRKELKEYLYEIVRNMEEETIKSIVSNHHYLDAFYAVF